MPPSCSCRATVLTDALLTVSAAASSLNDCCGGSQIHNQPYRRPIVRVAPIVSKNKPMRSTNSASSRGITLRTIHNIQYELNVLYVVVRRVPLDASARPTSRLLAMTDMFSLDGKVAVVTGGGRGIGVMMARGLLQAGAEGDLARRQKSGVGGG